MELKIVLAIAIGTCTLLLSTLMFAGMMVHPERITTWHMFAFSVFATTSGCSYITAVCMAITGKKE